MQNNQIHIEGGESQMKKKVFALLLCIIMTLASTSLASIAPRFSDASCPKCHNYALQYKEPGGYVYTEEKTENGVHYLRYVNYIEYYWECSTCRYRYTTGRKEYGDWMVDPDWPYN